VGERVASRREDLQELFFHRAIAVEDFLRLRAIADDHAGTDAEGLLVPRAALDDVADEARLSRAVFSYQRHPLAVHESEA
jgi:hypothetical protein